MLFQGFNHTNHLSSWTMVVIIAINHRRSLACPGIEVSINAQEKKRIYNSICVESVV
ncbi:hypothetical protein OIU74_013794 [Salix koriyanagi]|uniref:Uncharacterized protein n=1 Tax=Salix koriyanagi TaxID=2511006 RepID=A0A9Q0T6X3_9ROSI|nr:hypothetical protein OIU74_013794 [Salix koriyanagi]